MIDFDLIELKPPVGLPPTIRIPDSLESRIVCFFDFRHHGKLQTRLREVLGFHKIKTNFISDNPGFHLNAVEQRL